MIVKVDDQGTHREKGDERELLEAGERLLTALEEFVKPYEEENALTITISGREKPVSLVIKISPDLLRELGEEKVLEKLKKANSPKEKEAAVVKLLEHFGLNKKLIVEMLDKGELKNGMEAKRLFNTIMEKMSIAILRGKEHRPVIQVAREMGSSSFPSPPSPPAP